MCFKAQTCDKPKDNVQDYQVSHLGYNQVLVKNYSKYFQESSWLGHTWDSNMR